MKTTGKFMAMITVLFSSISARDATASDIYSLGHDRDGYQHVIMAKPLVIRVL